MNRTEYSSSAARVIPMPNPPAPEYSDEQPVSQLPKAETKIKYAGMDLPFLALTILILLIGVVMVLSASFVRAYYVAGDPLRFFLRQFMFAISGVGLMIIVSRINVKIMRHWSMWILYISVGLLVLVLMFGETVNNATRWIDIFGITRFQPSEVAKVAIILAFSRMICQFDEKMKTLKYGIFPFVVIVGAIAFLLMRQPHVSATIIIVAQTAIMLFAGGARLRWFVIPALIIAAVVGFLLFSMMQNSAEAEDGAAQQQTQQVQQRSGGRLAHVQRRIDSWLDPEADPQGAGFQARQSLYAVGSGGLFGVGLGQSRQKQLYLPEEHNDFIFAIVLEELGFIGGMMILTLFALLIIRGFWLALHARDRYGSLVVTGITALLAIQVFLNVAVVTNLIPATGISLPFFSYGGTALWLQLVQMGIVLSVSREIPLTKAG